MIKLEDIEYKRYDDTERKTHDCIGTVKLKGVTRPRNLYYNKEHNREYIEHNRDLQFLEKETDLR